MEDDWDINEWTARRSAARREPKSDVLDPFPVTQFPAIPTRITFTGDISAAKAHIGLGRKRLADLVTSSGFMELQTGLNTLELSDGTKIKTSIAYGLSNIEIHVPTGDDDLEPPDVPVCACCKGCVSIGTLIRNAYPRHVSVSGYINGSLFDVLVCKNTGGIYTEHIIEGINGFCTYAVKGTDVLVYIGRVLNVVESAEYRVEISNSEGESYWVPKEVRQVNTCSTAGAHGDIEKVNEAGFSLTKNGIQNMIEGSNIPLPLNKLSMCKYVDGDTLPDGEVVHIYGAPLLQAKCV